MEDTNTASRPAREDRDWKYAEKAMTWYGWGSPVGAGLFLVGVAAAMLLVRIAIFGL